ncbi:MAG TPA: bifunctional 5,10-methylenetetrahydrofolate dehydrogenase/5,10-methenyltetrahydrofolate cyclohydrolase, partial [Thermoanaerobaculia bacterium]|nr:bifunctional 5,10-methylenetetrahydrofolate dehydrogenase/5,10-methenyltetrahydrofolate cyclohydrolase [Thermoanaerobaculia bacterium]
MTTILDGKATAEAIRREVADGVAALVAGGARPPGLAVVLVGEDPASKVYVGSKIKACEEVGMVSRQAILPEDTAADALRRTVEELNADDAIDGFLVQLPLPGHLPEREILARVSPEKDVDGFHAVNVGRLWLGEEGFFAPATPSGVIELLKRYQIPLAGARAVIVGRSNI